jgi:hypothetical protein
MTAFQDLQATGWRDVAIGEVPEYIVYRDDRGTFTRAVNISFLVAVLIMLLVRGKTTVAVPFYGVGVFVPITMMGLAVRRHVKAHFTGRARTWGLIGSTLAAALSSLVFVGQIVGKWHEGGWMALIAFSALAVLAHGVLLSPVGYRDPGQIHQIVREKAKVQGAMASIVEWQSLKMQEYRYSLRQRVLIGIAQFFELFGVRRPLRYDPAPAVAGDYDHALHADHPGAPSILARYLAAPEPQAAVVPVPPIPREETAPPAAGTETTAPVKEEAAPPTSTPPISPAKKKTSRAPATPPKAGARRPVSRKKKGKSTRS